VTQDGLLLDPVSRRPLRLRDADARSVLARPVPRSADANADGTSVVVVTYDNLLFTRICLESILASGGGEQIVVVDNGSTDGSLEYLLELAVVNPRVLLDPVGRNLGFAAACNRGLSRADGETLVLLNNDTIVSTGWIDRLRSHLENPAVGMVGPVTNRIGTDAEIETTYRTLGEFHAFAAERAARHAGRSRSTRMLAMFCVALRREVLERVGTLDERFEVGMLEDDDYSARVTVSGYSLLCAEDAFVHHFGEASFGKLFRGGEHSRLLRRNRQRFEEKWGYAWQPYDRRRNDEYELLANRVVRTVASSTPVDATVMVVSRGDEALLMIPGRRGWHFPQCSGGVYSGHHPGDSQEAIAQLESMRLRGARYIVFPRTSLWWLEHYWELHDHLVARYRKTVDDAKTCVMFTLEEARR
jgi:GT2 family glycosyltransferase